MVNKKSSLCYCSAKVTPPKCAEKRCFLENKVSASMYETLNLF